MLRGSMLLTQKSPNYVSDSGYVIDSIYMPTVTDNLMIFDRLAKLLQVLGRVLGVLGIDHEV